MPELTSRQLAERLGVTKRHALGLLHNREISGRQLANGIWLADSDSVARYEIAGRQGSGRTLDASTGWALLWELSGRKADWLSGSTRARVRKRLRESDVEVIATVVSKRSTAHRFTAANSERAMSGLIRTGRTAADMIGTELIEDHRWVCGYVRSGTVEEYAKSHFMIPKPAGNDVIYDNTLPVDFGDDVMPPAVVAADLARSTDTRERSAGLRALERMRQEWLAEN